jgi:hypothetical protein
MDRISTRRLAGTVALTLLAGAAAAAPAAAQSGCAAPEETGAWHSCLTTAHRTIEDGPEVQLTQARPRLVVRYKACPARRVRRTVVIRTKDGERLDRTTVRSRCRRGVARWVVDLALDVELMDGTVVRSFWSGIADNGAAAPSVELKAKR